jgi:hypothetical protein
VISPCFSGMGWTQIQDLLPRSLAVYDFLSFFFLSWDEPTIMPCNRMHEIGKRLFFLRTYVYKECSPKSPSMSHCGCHFWQEQTWTKTSHLIQTQPWWFVIQTEPDHNQLDCWCGKSILPLLISSDETMVISERLKEFPKNLGFVFSFIIQHCHD